MSELQLAAICRIHTGKLDAFKEVARACMTSVREKDGGTLQYDWFLDPDGAECVIRERYRDSAAVLEHVANLGETMGELLGVCDLALRLYGDPSPELLSAIEGMDVRVYRRLQGL